MFSKSVFRRSCNNTKRTTGQTSASKRPTPRFTHLPHRQQQRAGSTQQPSQPSDQHNERRQQKPRGSVRPFTVLFTCIPLGYGINYALKKQNAAGQTSPDGFVKYALASREDVSSTCSIFSLIPSNPNAALDLKAPELERSITSVQIKQPQLQIARSYTLLPAAKGQDEDEVRLLIKREQRGEVSGYLHRLPLDAEVEVRGVSRECVIPKDLDEVVFLAGGTGIAPALQLADMLKTERTDMHILWANRKREECTGGTSDTTPASNGSWWDVSRLWSSDGKANAPVANNSAPITQQKHQMVQELDRAKEASGRLKVDYFVDEESTTIKPKEISDLLHSSNEGKMLLIVSGPEGFINYWAGPKQWFNGREVQGPIAGVLGSMNTAGWDIIKL